MALERRVRLSRCRKPCRQSPSAPTFGPRQDLLLRRSLAGQSRAAEPHVGGEGPTCRVHSAPASTGESPQERNQQLGAADHALSRYQRPAPGFHKYSEILDGPGDSYAVGGVSNRAMPP
jgi:hypothetical protein